MNSSDLSLVMQNNPKSLLKRKKKKEYVNINLFLSLEWTVLKVTAKCIYSTSMQILFCGRRAQLLYIFVLSVVTLSPFPSFLCSLPLYVVLDWIVIYGKLVCDSSVTSTCEYCKYVHLFPMSWAPSSPQMNHSFLNMWLRTLRPVSFRCTFKGR